MLILFSSFCGCMNQKKSPLKEVGQDVILYTSLTHSYDYEKLYRFLKKEPSLNDVCIKYHINCYKQAGNSKYIVLKTTMGVVVVFFAEPNTEILQSIDANAISENLPYETINIQIVLFSKDGNPEFFKNANIGIPLEDVQEADPSGDYPFLYHDWSGYPKYSYHYFENGNCYIVYYDEMNMVSDILFFTI